MSCSRYCPVALARIDETRTQVEQLAKWWGCAPDTLWKVHSWVLRQGRELHLNQAFHGPPFQIKGDSGAFERART